MGEGIEPSWLKREPHCPGRPMSNCPIRILCVDDHHLLRAGILRTVSQYQDLAVVAEAASGIEAVSQFMRHQPDVTLMDLQLPLMGGLQSIQTIRRARPDARIVVLTMSDGEHDIYSALEAGAMGYLLKDSPAGNLVQAIYDVHGGRRSIPFNVEAKLQLRARLTSRETQTVRLLGMGMRDKEIALRLSIGVETVRAHMKNAFRKLNVHDRTAAFAEAIKRGIVSRH